MIKMGALWAHKDKEGNDYMSGTINQNCRILVYKNGYKTEEKHPDFIVYFAENKKRDENA